MLSSVGSMGVDDADLGGAARFDVLREAYLPRLRERLGELVRELEAGAHDASARIAHKIAGAAGSYGYSEVSEEARRIERGLEGCPPHTFADAARALLASLPSSARAAREAALLVIESNPKVRARCVGEITTPLLFASDGMEALGLAMDRPVLGILLPWSARPLVRSLRSDERLRALPLAITSVKSGDEERAVAKTGARFATTAPVGPETVARALVAVTAVDG